MGFVKNNNFIAILIFIKWFVFSSKYSLGWRSGEENSSKKQMLRLIRSLLTLQIIILSFMGTLTIKSKKCMNQHTKTKNIISVLQTYLGLFELTSSGQAPIFYTGQKTSILPQSFIVKTLMPCHFAVAIKALVGAKIVYSCYENFPYNINGSTKFKSEILRKLEGYFIKYVDEIITVNKYMADLISKDYNVPKVYWIPKCGSQN